MSFHSFFFSHVIIQIISHVLVGVILGFNVFFDTEMSILFLFNSDLGRSDISAVFTIFAFKTFNIFSEVVAISINSVNISSEGDDFNILLRVHVFYSGTFFFSVIKRSSFCSDIVTSGFNNSVLLIDSYESFLQIKF